MNDRPEYDPSRILYLDVDGVLNRQGRESTPYVLPDCMAELNRIIDETRACIYLTSSWGGVIPKLMTLKGFGMLLATHGFNHWRAITGQIPVRLDVDAYQGVTEFYRNDREWRIFTSLKSKGPTKFAILDDFDLKFPEPYSAGFFQTDPRVGLSPEIADAVIERLRKE